MNIHKVKDDDDIIFHLMVIKKWIRFYLLIKSVTKSCLHIIFTYLCDQGNGKSNAKERDATFCLPKYEMKFKTCNRVVFIFKVDKIIHLHNGKSITNIIWDNISPFSNI
jgi:hypothetical protein